MRIIQTISPTDAGAPIEVFAVCDDHKQHVKLDVSSLILGCDNSRYIEIALERIGREALNEKCTGCQFVLPETRWPEGAEL